MFLVLAIVCARLSLWSSLVPWHYLSEPLCIPLLTFMFPCCLQIISASLRGRPLYNSCCLPSNSIYSNPIQIVHRQRQHPLRILSYRAGVAAGAEDAAAAAAAATAPGIGSGTALLGLLRSSIVIPSSFVMPTTGASPFLTNSYMPTGRC